MANLDFTDVIVLLKSELSRLQSVLDANALRCEELKEEVALLELSCGALNPKMEAIKTLIGRLEE